MRLKAGDPVEYVITLNNTSTADTPNLDCTISDTAIGFSKNVVLAAGENDASTVPFTIPGGDGEGGGHGRDSLGWRRARV